MTEDEVIEKFGDVVLRDLCDRRGIRHAIESCDDDIQQEIKEAIGRAILSLLPSLGLVMVPVEASDFMLVEGEKAWESDNHGVPDIWSRMLRASPFYKGERG